MVRVRPRANRRRMAAIAVRSSARRRSQIGHAPASGSTRLTTISRTSIPVRSSARDPVAGLRQRERLRQRDPGEPGPLGIAQPCRRFRVPARRARRSGDRLPRAGRPSPAARESAGAAAGARPAPRRRRPPFPARPAAAACVRSARYRRRSDRSEERAASRSISIIPISSSTPGIGQVEQRVDVLAIEPGAVLEDLAERAAVLLQPARERTRRIQLHGVERGRDPAGRAGQGDAERVAEGMRGIGRDQQDAAFAPAALRRAKARGFRHGEGGGGRRLADAALASIKDKPGVMNVRSQNLEVRTKRKKPKGRHSSRSSKL